MTDEFINEEDVQVSPRGRKTQIDPDLAALMKKLKAGQAVRLSSTFGNVPKEKRATVSAIIRKHVRHVRDEDCRIDYTTDGIPQVRIRNKK